MIAQLFCNKWQHVLSCALPWLHNKFCVSFLCKSRYWKSWRQYTFKQAVRLRTLLNDSAMKMKPSTTFSTLGRTQEKVWSPAWFILCVAEPSPVWSTVHKVTKRHRLLDLWLSWTTGTAWYLSKHLFLVPWVWWLGWDSYSQRCLLSKKISPSLAYSLYTTGSGFHLCQGPFATFWHLQMVVKGNSGDARSTNGSVIVDSCIADVWWVTHHNVFCVA